MDPRDISDLISEDPDEPGWMADVQGWMSDCQKQMAAGGYDPDKAYQKCSQVIQRAQRDGVDERTFMRKLLAWEKRVARNRKNKEREAKRPTKRQQMIDMMLDAWKSGKKPDRSNDPDYIKAGETEVIDVDSHM